jgi:Protein of unknown function (DUF3408).
MAKKESPKVDENFMRAMISEGIPIKREAMQQQAKEEGNTPVQKVEAEKHEADQPQEERYTSRPRESKKKKDTEENYEDTYFAKVDFSNRQMTTITRDTHQKLSQIVSLIGGKNGTIGSYLENIIRRHFDLYRDEINALCERKPQKPL